MSVRLSPSIKNLFLPRFIWAAICLTPRVAQVEMLLRKIAHKYFIFMRLHSQANKLLLRQPQCFNRLLVFRFRTHTLFDTLIAPRKQKRDQFVKPPPKQVWSIIKYLNLIEADKFCRCWHECSEDIIMFSFNLSSRGHGSSCFMRKHKSCDSCLTPDNILSSCCKHEKSQRLLSA